MIAYTLNMCAPYILCTFDNLFDDLFLGLLNLDIMTSTRPLNCLRCLSVCNL